MATTKQRSVPGGGGRQIEPGIDHDRAEPLEAAEGAALRRTPEQAPGSAAPRIGTTAEPIRPTPDDALHGTPPDLTDGHQPHRAADEPLHWGAIAAIAVVVGLFLFAIASLIAAG